MCGRFVLIQQLSLIITFLKGFFSCLLAWNRVSPRILELHVMHSVQQLHVELYNLKPLFPKDLMCFYRVGQFVIIWQAYFYESKTKDRQLNRHYCYLQFKPIKLLLLIMGKVLETTILEKYR